VQATKAMSFPSQEQMTTHVASEPSHRGIGGAGNRTMATRKIESESHDASVISRADRIRARIGSIFA
jgi:hypothetical protein